MNTLREHGRTNVRRRTIAKQVVLLGVIAAQFAGSIAFAPGASAALLKDDYPYKSDSMSSVDPWSFYKRNCTSFVAWRLNNDRNVGFSNSYGGAHWGNAHHWNDAATSIGRSVNSTPVPGSVAYWERSSSSPYGHVAYVAAVSVSSGRFVVTIEEYNYRGDGKYTKRTLTSGKSGYPNGFIHIKDGPSDNTWYSLLNPNGKAIDVAGGSTAEGTPIQQYTYNGTYAQRWYFTFVGSGETYRIRNRNNSNMAWTVRSDDKVELRTYDGSRTQWWTVAYVKNGYYKFVSVADSSKCLDVPGNSSSDSVQLQVYSCNGTNAQLFRMKIHA